MASGVKVPLTFTVFRQGQQVRTLTLTQDVIKVGKLSSSHLRIDDDDGVSRMHAVIEVTGADEVHVIDLGSTRGTIVNGQKVNKARLKSGDEIQLGETRVQVAIGAAEMADEATQVSAPPNGSTLTQTPAVPAPAAAVLSQMPSMPERAGAGPAAPLPPAPQSGPFPTMQPLPAAPPQAFAPAPAPYVPPPAASMPSPFSPPPAPPAAPPAVVVQQDYQNQAAMALNLDDVEVRDGSRAIEVTVLNQDEVADVRHFTNPQSGAVTGTTKGLLAAAGLAVLGSLVIFFWTLSVASREVSQMEAWEKAGNERSKFMGRVKISPVVDFATIALFAFGIGGLLVGLRRRSDEMVPRDYTIGPGGVFKLAPEQVPSPAFPLVQSTGVDYALNFAPNMRGEVRMPDGSTTPVQNLRSPWQIPQGAKVSVDLDTVRFLVQSVPPPRKHPVPVLAMQWAEQVYTGGSAVAHGLFLVLVFSIPPDAKSLSLDLLSNDNRFAKYLTKPPEEKDEEIPEFLKKKGPEDQGGKGKRHKGEEGKMGKKDSKNKSGLYGLKGPKDNPDPHLAKQLAEEQAKNAGILGLLKKQEGSHIASIFGRDSALGTDAENALGGLIGNQVGEANGNGGLGLIGTGRGGGGTGEGTIGLGNLGTIGKGGGGGNGSGYGRGAGGLGGRKARAPDIIPGTANVRGSLDKEIIRRVIRKHINEVRFCYEQQAMKNPKLEGKVTVNFTISPEGAVVSSAVQASTLGNASAENCIAQAVRRWSFPKPQGGGIVQVSYPFVLKMSGD